MKIVFISPRPFGLLGTPGTYLLTESYGKFVDICVIANEAKKSDTPIVYQNNNSTNLHEIDFTKERFLDRIEAIIKEFDPHLVIIGNYARWFDIVARLKYKFEHLMFVLDIKTPLILDGQEIVYKQIQDEGIKHSCLLDLVMTCCQKDVDTWIPHCRVKTLAYPLGIKHTDYSPKQIPEDRIHCRRIIYVGSIHPRRKIDVMIRYISQLPEPLKRSVVFDFYGSGPAVSDLEQLVKALALEDIVSFKGYLDAQTLSHVLTGYDAGVAWVPYEIYDCAPSLKLIEYMAAGLVPIAMDTTAHKVYAKEGFHIEYFNNCAQSFADVIKRLCEQGFLRSHREKNLETILQHDWDVIASDIILPVFFQLIENRPEKKSAYVSNIYDRVFMWDLPGNPEKPDRVSSSKIRIAGIVGDRLYRGLDLECDLLLLTPQNWTQILSFTQPDFILVESTWITATGDWYMAQTIPGEENDLIHQLILTAKKKGIPTVFWMTKDSAYYPHYNRVAKAFDLVFCADPLSQALFIKEGIPAKKLLPAVQPVLFNPIQNIEKNRVLNTGTLYDGWVDLFRFPEIGTILKKIKGNNLNIFQTRLMMYKAQLAHTDKELVPFVQGTILDLLLPNLLKNASMYLGFEKGCKSKIEKSWDILEASASRIPLAYLGHLDKEDQLHGIVRSFEDESSFCDYVNSQKGGGMHLERDRHKSWRETCLNHVFAKRIQTICHKINIEYDWEEFPRASLVTGTMRPELLPKCFEQFEVQTYPNKELTLVFNGAPKVLENYQEKYSGSKDISIASIPLTSTVGTVLNYGLLKASGKYFFRIDDDDLYGPNYILDTLLYLRAVKADIFGKRASFFHFAGEPEIYLRNCAMPSIKTFPGKMLHKNQEYLISGCSFAASIELLKKYRFPDFIHASVDSAYIERIREQQPDLKCLLADNLNLVVERASDVSNHTWKIDGDDIKKKGLVITKCVDDLIC